jgi:hypothetical protein
LIDALGDLLVQVATSKQTRGGSDERQDSR